MNPFVNLFKVNPFIELILTIVDIYKMILVAAIILSVLIAFNIVNKHQQFVEKLHYFLGKLTDPILRHIRKYIPLIGNIDISPVILFLGLNFLKSFILYYAL